MNPDPFGRLQRDPAALSLPERVDVLRRLAGELQAGSRESRWLGRCIGEWLAGGGELEAVLGVKPARGSRLTAPAIAMQARRAEALLLLATAIGGNAAALRVLRGETPCPPEHSDLLEACRALGCPTSRAAVHRATVSRHRPSVRHPEAGLDDGDITNAMPPLPCDTPTTSNTA